MFSNDADLEMAELADAAGWAFCPKCGDEFRLRRSHPGPMCDPGGLTCEWDREREAFRRDVMESADDVRNQH